MPLNNLGMGFVFTAKDLASGTIRRLGKNFNKMGVQSQRGAMRMRAAMTFAGAGIALLVGGLVTLGAAVRLAGTAGEFEFEMARVGAISRATAEDMRVLNEAAKEAGILTQFSPKEAAEGLGAFALQGFSAKESARALKPALDFAAGGMVSVKQGAETMTAALRIFSLETDQAAITADKLLKVSNITALEAGDLKIALGNVARGAVAAEQSIDEMLPALGLVKNVGIDASVAGTSVSSALDFMTKNAKKLKKEFGVDIADAQGNVRNFLDIVNDLEKAGRRFGTAERLAKLTKTVGRFGKTAVVAIGAQLSKGIKDAEGNILKGADAIAFLRNEITGASGTAKEFRERLLDTFKGQKILLKGSLQTLAVSLGEPLAAALKPLVSLTIGAVNTIIKFIEGIPKPIKEVIGKLTLVFGALLTSGGIIALLIAAGTLLAGALKAIALGAGIALTIFAALGAALGTVVLVFKAYDVATRSAIDKTNFLTRAWDKLKLAFVAVSALITGKPISKAVVDDLQKAENEGVFNFVQSIGRLMIRAKRFFGGLSAGFSAIFRTAKPVFDALFESFHELGKALGFGGDAFNDFAGGPVEGFVRAGFRIGRAVAIAIKVLVRGLTFVISLVAGVIKGAKAVFSFFSPLINVLVASFGALFTEVGKLFVELGLVTEGMAKQGGAAGVLGQAIGLFAAFLKVTLVPALIFMVSTLRVVVAMFRVAVFVIKEGAKIVMAQWDRLSNFFAVEVIDRFKRWKDKLVEFIQPAIDVFNALAEQIGIVLDKLNELTGFTDTVGEAVDFVGGVASAVGASFDPEALTLESEPDTATGLEGRVFGGVGSAGPAAAARAATAPEAIAANQRIQRRLRGGLGGAAGRTAARAAGLDPEQARALGDAVAEALRKNPPTINVDGAELGGAASQGNDDNDAREFRQVGVGG